ncbi:MAG: glycosyl transferase group 1 [Glaciihabitans sp.]|nr:glycosyl transferase group 1 [Glaciihabitans sp.]
MPTGLRADRARVYEHLRSAHLERARQLPPAAIVYGSTRYDFEPALAEGLELRQAGTWRAVRLLSASRLVAIEVNEPLMLSSLPTTALLMFATRLRHPRASRRATIVTYAIENLDPFTHPIGARLRSRLKRRAYRMLATYVLSRIDRIAFGSPAAQALYADQLASRRRPVAQRVILALPAPAPDAFDNVKTPHSVAFLGAFSERKGFPLVIEAWPLVREQVRDATLVLLGKGALRDAAVQFAAADSSVRLILDPPRDEIAAELATARVLVLPSQPSPTWREQIGLPVVEALAQGCLIATTDQTALSAWLTEHGHEVVPQTADARSVAAAIVRLLRSPTPTTHVLDSLPAVDGRLAADEWLFEGAGASRD